MIRSPVCAALVVLAAAAHAAHADVVRLKNGQLLEGKTTRTPKGLQIEQRLGSIVVPFSKIASVEEKETPGEVFVRRRKALKPGDADGRVALGGYALDHKYAKRARRMALEALVLSPGARGLPALLRRLDFHRVKGRGWLPPEIYYPSIGWVRFKNKWRSPAEMERIRAAEALATTLTALKRAARWARRSRYLAGSARRAVPRAASKLARARAEVAAWPAKVAAARAELRTREADLSYAETALLQATRTWTPARRERCDCARARPKHLQGSCPLRRRLRRLRRLREEATTTRDSARKRRDDALAELKRALRSEAAAHRAVTCAVSDLAGARARVAPSEATATRAAKRAEEARAAVRKAEARLERAGG